MTTLSSQLIRSWLVSCTKLNCCRWDYSPQSVSKGRTSDGQDQGIALDKSVEMNENADLKGFEFVAAGDGGDNEVVGDVNAERNTAESVRMRKNCGESGCADYGTITRGYGKLASLRDSSHEYQR